MLSNKDGKDRNKNLCVNCKGRNYLINCKCGKCNEIIFMINKHGSLREYKKNHYWINKKGNKAANFKGRVILDNGYGIIFKPNHPKANKRGRVLLHRFVYEYFHKCCLLDWIEIHHINGIKIDNHKNNLLLVTKSEHRKIEMIGKKYNKKDHSKTFCLLCNSNKTCINKYGYSYWHKYNNGYICNICSNRETYKKLRHNPIK